MGVKIFTMITVDDYGSKRHDLQHSLNLRYFTLSIELHSEDPVVKQLSHIAFALGLHNSTLR